jgi:hypothetical protein
MPDGVDRAQGTVPPENPDFLDAQPLPPGQKERFDIKAETIYPAVFKNLPDRRPPKTFKTALGIADPGNSQNLHESVKDFPQANPVQRLAFKDLARPARPGTNGDIIAIPQGGQELAHLSNRRGQIGVTEQDIFPDCR